MAERSGTSMAFGLSMLVASAVIIDSVFTGRAPWEVVTSVIRGNPLPAPKASASVTSATPASGTGATAVPGITSTTNGIGVSNKGLAAAQWAKAQVGTPYKVGPHRFGDDPTNKYFDCSGLVYAAYKAVGTDIGATVTYDQVKQGKEIPIDPANVQPGDLLFFYGDSPARNFGHVAIALDPTTEVQAPHTGDVVKVTPIDYGRVQAIRRMV